MKKHPSIFLFLVVTFFIAMATFGCNPEPECLEQTCSGNTSWSTADCKCVEGTCNVTEAHLEACNVEGGTYNYTTCQCDF